MTAAQRPVGSSIYRFATSVVIAIRSPGSGHPVPTLDGVGLPWALAFTDADAARRRAAEIDGASVAQLQMVDLAGMLPANWGILLDPDSEAPIAVPPEDKPGVVAAASPFPAEARVEVDNLNAEGRAMITGLPERLNSVAGLDGAHIVWHRVEDADDDVIVVVFARTPGARDDAARTVQDWLTANEPPFRMLVIDGATIPSEFRGWFIERVPEAGTSAH
jgi:hypothetical protein